MNGCILIDMGYRKGYFKDMYEYINIGLNIESFIYIITIIVGFIILIAFLKLDWRRYGLLYVIATLTGNIICYIFVKLNFYSYPYLLLPTFEIMPISAIAFSFPVMVLITVRYSPEKWIWKIPFYMTIVHVGVLMETWILNNTRMIEYNYKWDLWDSYTSWWIFFLLFEWIGGLIIPNHFRKPLDSTQLKYGKLGWAAIHFVFIATIFLVGYYLGTLQAK